MHWCIWTQECQLTLAAYTFMKKICYLFIHGMPSFISLWWKKLSNLTFVKLQIYCITKKGTETVAMYLCLSFLYSVVDLLTQAL